MKKAIFIIIISISILIINNLAHSIYGLWQKKDLVIRAKKELQYRKEENKKLKSELSWAQTNKFVEKEARDKLFFVKEGEEQVLVSREFMKNPIRNNEELENSPNWRKWWELFF